MGAEVGEGEGASKDFVVDNIFSREKLIQAENIVNCSLYPTTLIPSFHQLTIGWNLLHDGSAHLCEYIRFSLVKLKGKNRVGRSFYLSDILLQQFFLRNSKGRMHRGE